MTKIDAEREAFEKWAKTSMNAGSTNGLARKESGEYLWSGTSLCWDVWQAARAQQLALSESKHAESVRCMSVVMTDIANLLGIPAKKHGDPDLIFEAIETLQGGCALPATAPKVTRDGLGTAVQAIEFALGIDDHWDMRQFLDDWMHGDVSEWPEYSTHIVGE